MTEVNLDAESITRNKAYGATDHLQHLLKIGWTPDSQIIKKLMKENNLTSEDLSAAFLKLNEIHSKECCIDRENKHWNTVLSLNFVANNLPFLYN